VGLYIDLIDRKKIPKGEIQEEVEHFTENKVEQFARSGDASYMQAVREVQFCCSVGTKTEVNLSHPDVQLRNCKKYSV